MEEYCSKDTKELLGGRAWKLEVERQDRGGRTYSAVGGLMKTGNRQSEMKKTRECTGILDQRVLTLR